MTHDELLEEINDAITDFDLKYDNSNPYYKALRAVVELHKPIYYRKGAHCAGCGNYGVYDETSVEYPCPTIQAIERELQ